MFGIADGNPGVAHEVDIAGKTFNFFCFEIKRIARDEDGGIGAALKFDGAADVVKCAAPGADVEVGVIGFEVLLLLEARQRCLGGYLPEFSSAHSF